MGINMWACGVTTIDCEFRPERRKILLPQTLASLEVAGFPSPRLFVDGADNGTKTNEHLWTSFNLPVTFRNPRIFAFGNWMLGAIELFIRQPAADYYAMFQDDIVLSKNVRQFLERTTWPSKTCYLSLYTAGAEQEAVSGKPNGWYESPPITGRDFFDIAAGAERRQQAGQGALALIFTREGLHTLFKQPHFVERPMDVSRGQRNIDGGIVEAMNKSGWRCWVHNPGLVQHKGEHSTISGIYHRPSQCFAGEKFDALSLLPTT